MLERLPLCFLGLAIPLMAGTSVLRLPPGVPIVLAVDAPGPIRQAAGNLQRDLAKVLGAPSPLIDRTPAGSPCIEILPPDSALGGPEAHAVRVVANGSAPARVTLAGSDERGVIYAIYTFSERALGIPPLWFYADWKPAHLDALDLPGDIAVVVAAPHVRWRAWFLNDQDMLGSWESRNFPEGYDRMLETMLRLKLNVIDLGSFIDFPQPNGALKRARLARDRGLVITTTHTSPLGTNWRAWDSYWKLVRHRDPPPLRLDEVKAMEEFWAYFIDLGRREHLDMIWEIGFRGSTDAGFFETFKDAPADDAGRAAIISDMIRRQVALLHRRYDAAPVRMRTVLYNENSDYLAAGLLHLPAEPDLIWNYVAARRDHFPAADIRRGNLPAMQPYGYYLNLQFTSTGAHLAPAEGPWKLARNYEVVAAASPRPLDFWVVNAGNIREFLQELTAHATLAWKPEGWSADAHLLTWCTAYFGAEHARAAAGVIQAYYDSFWTQRAPDLPNFPRQYLFQDMRVARACDELLAHWQSPLAPLSDRNTGYYRIDPAVEGTDDQYEALARGLGRAVRKLADVATSAARLEPQLDARGRRLWHDHVRVPAQVVLAADQALLALLRGSRERSDPAARQSALREAAGAFAEMRTWLDRADAAPFEKWSASERLWGIQAKLRRIEELTASKAADAVRTSGSRSVENMVAGRLAAITVATRR